jgi:hypothetical protein
LIRITEQIFLRTEQYFQCTSHCLVKKALYYLKERKFFDRQDIKETICTLRKRQITTFDENQIHLIKNLMKLISGLSIHLKCGPTENNIFNALVFQEKRVDIILVSTQVTR